MIVKLFEELISHSNVSFPPLEAELITAGLQDSELTKFLTSFSNGFFSVDLSIHIFGIGKGLPDHHNYTTWNSAHLWRDSYELEYLPSTFFAENIFGDQYFLAYDGGVSKFDAETGESWEVSRSFESFITGLLYDDVTENDPSDRAALAHGQSSTLLCWR